MQLNSLFLQHCNTKDNVLSDFTRDRAFILEVFEKTL